MKLKAYSCIDCGVINVFKAHLIDGLRCMECGGPLVPMGKAITSKEHTKAMTIGVKVDTTEIDNAINKVNRLYDRLSQVKIRLDIIDALSYSIDINNG